MTEYRNKAMQSAYDHGRIARSHGKPDTANPYGDSRTDRGGVTFARAFRRAWQRGWESGEVESTAAAVR